MKMSKQVNKISPLFALARCLLLATLSLSALLAGCDKEEHQSPVAEGNVPISFSATALPMQPASRAETTTANILSMRVFASYTKTEDFGATWPMNYMYNQEVTRTSHTSPWTYSPVKYWPNKKDEKISFFAYSPYNQYNFKLSPNSANGYPYLECRPAADSSTDLVCASVKNKTYASSSGGGINFEMNHVMTRIKVSILNKDKMANMKLKYFFIGKQGDGTYSFADDSWSILGTPGRTNFSPQGISWPKPVPSDGTALELLPHYYFVPTGNMSTAMHPDFTICYTAPGSSGTEETIELKNQFLPSTEKWLTGAYLSYKIVIEKQKITVTASSHPTWTDAGTGTVVGTLSIVYAVNPSDPSWSNGGTGSIDGVPVVTHTVQPGEVMWENRLPEIIEVTP